MAKKLSSVLGIDIGSHSIKVCEVKASGNQATISAVGITPTPEGAVDYSGIYNPEAVGLALKQVLAESGAGSQFAVVSLAGQQSVLVRVIPVPRMGTDKELASHMEWEISKNIPFAETTVMSDYKVLPNDDPASAEMDVVMAVSPQSAIEAALECVKRSGRKPHALDVQPLGMARLVSRALPEVGQNEGVCIVDIGHSTTSINLFEGNKLLLPRPVPGGGEMITRAIADAQGIGIVDAEEYKLNRFHIPADASAQSNVFDPFAVGGGDQSYDAGFNPGGYAPSAYDSNVTTDIPAAQMEDMVIDPITGLPLEPQADNAYSAADPFAVPDATYANDPFGSTSEPDAQSAYAAPAQVDASFDAVRGILEELVSEIRRSVDYYTGRGGSVTRVVLCGGGARLNGLTGYLERSLGINTQPFDPLKNLGVSTKKASPEYINEYRQQLAVAVGNGLHILFD